MRISIRNVGPVKNADIELASMTVFIGPNNSGKSVAATALYALLTPAHTIRTLRGGQAENLAASFIKDMLATGNLYLIQEAPTPILDFFNGSIKSTLLAYLDAVVGEMQRTTGPSVSGLRMRNRDSILPASVTITSKTPEWAAKFEIIDDNPRTKLDAAPDIAELCRLFSQNEWQSISRFSGRKQADRFMISLLEQVWRDVPQRSWYLPAARSGILQSHKALAGSLVRRYPTAGTTDLGDPLMTATVADFLGGIIELRQDYRGPFSEEADRIEREILHGEIGLAGDPFPEVVFRDAGGEYPTGRTSSMVSELAPVVLYLRHRLQPGELLIVEEPEAHLHPATQVAFARCLVRLVNKGLRVCLTTHSEFFLQQINNAIMASALTEDRVADLDISTERLDSEKAAAYFFDPSPSGTIVRRLPIYPREGIPEVSFDAVTEQLYNETIALDRSIGGEED
jgi:energy-coupling factor transporter ATP-binding protein EcfA2